MNIRHNSIDQSGMPLYRYFLPHIWFKYRCDKIIVRRMKVYESVGRGGWQESQTDGGQTETGFSYSYTLSFTFYQGWGVLLIIGWSLSISPSQTCKTSQTPQRCPCTKCFGWVNFFGWTYALFVIICHKKCALLFWYVLPETLVL